MSGARILGIRSHAGPSWTASAQPGRHAQNAASRVSARASTFDAEISRTGDLKITTQDGDTVSISFSALQPLHAESFRGKADGARVNYRNAQSASQVSVSIGVEGSLDSGEVADIGRLLDHLAHPGQDAAHALGDSLEGFTYAYQEQINVDYSSSRVSVRA